jgi:DNA invertase Pin-like site-specific DNA recombinase
MTEHAHQKVTARHLARKAYLYIRQSTLRQVLENTESTQRQYALRQRAVALGWPSEQVIVIDRDLGQSGASAADREGFQQLVTEVGMGRAGIVMGLEVSRLARNSTDWHRLLEICALSDTLILDEDGIYDPAHFNDRLLLGLKGTMSEAELHVLKARLRGGVLNKARRGELEVPLPIGFVYDGAQRVVLDPDQQVREVVQLLFATFRRTGSATATVKAFRAQALRFPRRARHGAHKGDLLWTDLEHSRVLWILHHPRYAGVFCFGRTRQRKTAGARGGYRRLPRDEWIAFLPNAHPAYLSLEEFEENQRRLIENAASHGTERQAGPPREGPALLQGLIICGKCGDRMTVRYHQSHGEILPDYACQRRGIRTGQPACQLIPGASIDHAVGQLVVEAVSPMALEATLAVQQELQARREAVERLRHQQVERARYEAELARRRYMRVDPDNRLVAAALEAEWNEKLRAQLAAQEEYERQSRSAADLDETQRTRILALAGDVPQLWQDPAVAQRERKRMVRLLLEDVTLRRDRELTVQVRFRAGATHTLTLPLPMPAWQLRQTSPNVIAEIDRLLDHHTDADIAALLNQRGFQSGEHKPFHRLIVHRLREEYELTSLYERLRRRGLLTQEEIATELGVCIDTVKIWRRRGLLRAHRYDERGDHLYEPPGQDRPIKGKWKQRRGKRPVPKVTTQRPDEVQCDA